MIVDVIDRLFVLGNWFHFLFANVFSAQFTVILVNAKVYLAKFQQKFAIRESFFLKFCVFYYFFCLFAKVSAQASFNP